MPNLLTRRRIIFPRFDPRSIPGLGLWLDAADASTITLESGVVSQWNDKSYFGRNAAQADSTRRPGTTNINGLNVLNFDGTNDYIDAVFTPPSQPVTIYVVYRMTAIGSNRCVFDSQSGGTGFALYSPSANMGFASPTLLTWTGGAVIDELKVVCVSANGASTFIRSGGVEVASGNSGANSLSSGVRIGSIRTAAGPFQGQVCEFLMYQGLQDITSITQLERYLMQKWGVS